MIPASSDAAQPDAAMASAPADWRQQFRQAFTDPLQLLQSLGLAHLAPQLSGDCSAFPMRVPRVFAARMRHGDPNDPLLRQVLPLNDEDEFSAGYRLDPVGDHSARTAKGVLQKYAGRALLIATGSCAVNCRYCFRRHYPYSEDIAAAAGWRSAVQQIAADTSISEVILSGGDPLALSTAKLAELSNALGDIPHVRRLRIHTRLPVVLPARIDNALRHWLQSLPQRVVVVIHANHAQEIDPSVGVACARLRDAGASLLNQTVLLRGVNDHIDALCDLSERVFDIGVLPYYLHQLDRVAGATHYAVSDSNALQLHAELRSRLPGYLVPRLVREIEGKASKTPLSEGQFT